MNEQEKKERGSNSKFLLRLEPLGYLRCGLDLDSGTSNQILLGSGGDLYK